MEPNNQQPNNNNQANTQQPTTTTQPQNQPVNQPKPQQPQQPQPQKTTPVGKTVVTPNNKRNLYISGVLILIVLVLLTLVPYVRNRTKSGTETKDVNTEDTGCQPGFKFNIKTGEPCPVETSDKAASATPVASSGKTLTRAQAQAKYANQMIAISGSCSVDPEALTATKGATILLDNDTAKAHTMTVGKKSYRISPYHYTLSWLNTSDETLKVTCDGKEVGTVTVQ